MRVLVAAVVAAVVVGPPSIIVIVTPSVAFGSDFSNVDRVLSSPTPSEEANVVFPGTVWCCFVALVGDGG